MSAPILLLALLPVLGAAQPGGDALARGDAAWARRAEGHDGARAAAGPIAEAVAAYAEALEGRPDDLETRAKLLRALYFQGDYAAQEKEEKRQIFDRGRLLAEAGLDQLAARVGGRKKLDKLEPAEVARALAGVPGAAPVFFWSAVHWGLWGDHFGKMAAARKGVAGRLRRYAEIVNLLDEGYEGAGGRRLLGRLHTLAPKIPLVTGWVDRDRALAELRRAVAVAPDEAFNLLYLAEAILEFQPEKKAEAFSLLRRVVDQAPDPEGRVEQTRVQTEARKLLGEVGR